MKLTVDLDKTGFEALFHEPWKASLADGIYSGKLGQGFGSFKALQATRDAGYDVSRASVINFLSYLQSLGFTYERSATGKGGERRQYYTDPALIPGLKAHTIKVETIWADVTAEYARIVSGAIGETIPGSRLSANSPHRW